MMSSDKLRARLAKADAAADRAAETAAQAHETAPGSGIEAEALDELVTARHERWTLEKHLDVALAHEAGVPLNGTAADVSGGAA